MKGSYVLLIKLNENITIHIGKLGKIYFCKGFYVYIGSALNSLESRLNRHLRKNKNIHWHIDYFLNAAKIIDIYYNENLVKDECVIANNFEKKLLNINDFGSSDCKCKSHLFYGNFKDIISIIKKLKMNKYRFDENT
ncbi:MAG: endonuclease [Thermoplasmatales archaeon SG8-52-3]|nr:MAG: endonuclease [Thermoplasmatales archaeon SG8-52-3]